MYIQNRETHRYRKKLVVTKGERVKVLLPNLGSSTILTRCKALARLLFIFFSSRQGILIMNSIVRLPNELLLGLMMILWLYFFFCFYLILTQILKCFILKLIIDSKEIFFFKNIQGILMKSLVSPNGNIFCNNYSTT